MGQLHLSEEEEDEEKAAKLGLDLFNCQASAKCHRTKPRTPGMEELRQSALDVTLIASRQHRMAQLMEDVAQQIRNMSSRGATGLREEHRVVLSNLDHVQERARHIYSQIGGNAANPRWVEEAMEELQRVNHSWGLILVATEGARSWLENRLQRLHAVFYPTGQNPSAVSTCIQHGSYFVLLVALLVATPPRAILLPLFLASSVLGKLLGIPALSALLAVAVAGHWLVVATRRNALEARSVFHRHRLTSTPNREHNVELLREELDRMEISCLREPSCLEHPPATAGDAPGLAGRPSSVSGRWRTKLTSCRVMLEPALGARERWEPKPCSPSQSPANDPSPRSPCQGLTKAGQRCRKTATPGQNFCHVHATPRASCGGLAVDSPVSCLTPHPFPNRF
ncbi:protein brambleberry-like isoform 2-T2 [Chlamydotis macqueenii]